MYIDNEKVILTDCDGVLLDWQYHFHRWMDKKGFELVNSSSYKVHEQYGMKPLEAKYIIRHFNESAEIKFLSPLRDAVKYVRKLHEEHGYVFHCITSMTDNAAAQHLRKENLEMVFGKNIFEELIILGCGADKDEALLPYKDSECYWIEDKIENAKLGTDLGLKSILVSHIHNKHYKGNIPVVSNWKEIYDIVTGAEPWMVNLYKQ